MNRVLTIARNDFRHALHNRLVLGAALLLGVMFLPSVGAGATDLWEHIVSMIADLIPFSVIVFAAVGHNSITGERAEGITRFVLGLSATRRDLVLGKFLSRFSIVILALGLVLTVACIQTVQIFGLRALIPFWVMGGWMFVYGIVWTGITIGFSAAFSSQYRTLGALFTTYAVFSPALSVWGTFVQPLFAFAFTGSFSLPYFKTLAEAPSWVYFMLRVNPLQGFAGMVQWSVSMTTGRTPIIGLSYNILGIAVFFGLGALVLRSGVQRFERADLDADQSGPGWSNKLLPTVRSTAVTRSGSLPFISLPDDSRVGTIVRGDLNRSLKNWVVQGVVLLFFLAIIPEIWQSLKLTLKGDYAGTLSVSTRYTFTLPIFVLGTGIGYQAIVGERDSSTIRYVLGLPSTRRDLVISKLFARSAISITAILAALLFSAFIIVVRLGSSYFVSFLVGAAWVLLLGIVWTTFVVGVSAAVSSRYRSLAVILGVCLLFSVDNGLWGSIVRPFISLVFTGQFTTPQSVYTTGEIGPIWFRYLDSLNPLVALGNVFQALNTAAGVWELNTTIPYVLFSILVILIFAGGTLYMGYRRFERTDLG